MADAGLDPYTRGALAADSALRNYLDAVSITGLAREMGVRLYTADLGPSERMQIRYIHGAGGSDVYIRRGRHSCRHQAFEYAHGLGHLWMHLLFEGVCSLHPEDEMCIAAEAFAHELIIEKGFPL